MQHAPACRKPVRVVEGGASRAESVLLAALEANEGRASMLAVHDGARPLVLPEQVDELIRLGQRTYAAAPAAAGDGHGEGGGYCRGWCCPHRTAARLFAVQTPQVFQANLLKAALQSAIAAEAPLTDDCSAVERLGKEVYLTPGWRENIKITTAGGPVCWLRLFLRRREVQSMIESAHRARLRRTPSGGGPSP